ncbi:hypothetical protein CEXT_85121, partial [Caerostris extrusa]
MKRTPYRQASRHALLSPELAPNLTPLPDTELSGLCSLAVIREPSLLIPTCQLQHAGTVWIFVHLQFGPFSSSVPLAPFFSAERLLGLSRRRGGGHLLWK